MHSHFTLLDKFFENLQEFRMPSKFYYAWDKMVSSSRFFSSDPINSFLPDFCFKFLERLLLKYAINF